MTAPLSTSGTPEPVTGQSFGASSGSEISRAKAEYECASALWLKQPMSVTMESEVYRDLVSKRNAYVDLLDNRVALACSSEDEEWFEEEWERRAEILQQAERELESIIFPNVQEHL